jgi:outer membrane protein OmpA-like peptidoglycan-associated protein
MKRKVSMLLKASTSTFLLLFVTVLLPHVASGKDIGQMPYRYSYRSANGIESKDQFVICDGCSEKKRLRVNFTDVPLKVKTLPNLRSPKKSTSNESRPCRYFTVYFGWNRDQLTPDEKKHLLQQIQSTLSEAKISSKEVIVSGYTGHSGTKRYLAELALRRADSVALILKENGIFPDVVTGKGKCCYVSQDKDGPVNRRVEIKMCERRNNEK